MGHWEQTGRDNAEERARARRPASLAPRRSRFAADRSSLGIQR